MFVEGVFLFFEELNCLEELVLVLLNVEEALQELDVISLLISCTFYFFVLEPSIVLFCL